MLLCTGLADINLDACGFSSAAEVDVHVRIGFNSDPPHTATAVSENGPRPWSNFKDGPVEVTQ
jgi:hypothetical protein